MIECLPGGIARMSEFVNYKTRSVTLPPGCKNLIDVLQPDALPADEPPTVTRGESFAGRLSDIEKYVAMVFESRAWSFILMVTPPEEQFTIHVDRMDGIMEASVMVQTGTDQERAVHSFFASRDLDIPKNSEMPPQFLPDVPVQVTCDILPFPTEAPLLSKLIAAMLRDAFGLSDDSQLCFRCYETRVIAE
jgi:hypothetical protein